MNSSEDLSSIGVLFTTVESISVLCLCGGWQVFKTLQNK